MKTINPKVLGMLVLAFLLLAACGPAEIPVTGKVQPAVVEPIEGSEFSSLTLTEKAAERLDIETAPVEMREMSSEHLAVPYSAVLYGLDGETWVYTNPEPLVYIRQPIVIDFIDGDWAALLEGPEVGTQVVTVGVPLLYGTEVGVSK
jgi:multidrug efflux pump subunit AcrA (membrane-fusion protein)